ncbi:MAG TPA: hypothetical protein VN754_11190 [Candidatus Binataceae bacterium]|nr:hypothetical protein [Candidatus Binataceae bacterium]
MAKLNNWCEDLAAFWTRQVHGKSNVPAPKCHPIMPDLIPPTTANNGIRPWLRQGAYVVAYVWGFALFVALGTKGCDWISAPSNTMVALGLASVVASIFGAAVLVSQIVRKVIETGRANNVRQIEAPARNRRDRGNRDRHSRP